MSSSVPPVDQLTARLDRLEAVPQEKDALSRSSEGELATSEVTNETKTEKEEREEEDATAIVPPTFYITTAIHYTNGKPHVGHAYENITADAIARYHRAFGREVFFLTGTDEHGQKVATTAEAAGITPQAFCDKYSGLFRQFARDVNMSNDHFVRTTDEMHKACAQWAFGKAVAQGDIYKDVYEGWYNVREETFVSETEARNSDFKDPMSGVPYKQMKEESYFFRMSKYQQRLIDHIKANPNFILPEFRREFILKRLEEPLRDLSVSRNTFSHGIPLPNDDGHVMYVWFDALSNYLSGIGYDRDAETSKFWPADVHIIGKDIIWFHTVIWPCMLMSIGVEPPRMIFGHGFVNAGDGRKMSKSLGNVVDPYAMLAKYDLDTLRYFICRGTAYGSDMPFSEDDLINMHNSELADALGNLVHRATTLCGKYSKSCIPDVKPEVIFSLPVLRKQTETVMKTMALQDACILAINCAKDTNKYLTDKAPWHIKNDLTQQQIIVRSVLEAVYVAAHFLSPFMPRACEKIFEKLQTPPTHIAKLRTTFDNLSAGTKVDVGEILFKKLLTEEEKRKAEEKKSSAVAASKAKANKAPKAPVPLFAAMDIRVGKITKVWDHPDSEKLFCEEIDVGEDEPRQIASGLRAFYSSEEMENRKVLVICNLKPAKLGGFKSHGMVLCASNEEHTEVEFVAPPADAPIGQRVFIATETGDAVSAGQMKKQKIWEKASADLKTSDAKQAMYKDQVIMTSAGPCTAPKLANARIS